MFAAKIVFNGGARRRTHSLRLSAAAAWKFPRMPRTPAPNAMDVHCVNKKGSGQGGGTRSKWTASPRNDIRDHTVADVSTYRTPKYYVVICLSLQNTRLWRFWVRIRKSPTRNSSASELPSCLITLILDGVDAHQLLTTLSAFTWKQVKGRSWNSRESAATPPARF